VEVPVIAAADVSKSASMAAGLTTEQDSVFRDLRLSLPQTSSETQLWRVSTLATVGILENSRHVRRHEDAWRIGVIREFSRGAMSKG
jgi:hypothetical protein